MMMMMMIWYLVFISNTNNFHTVDFKDSYLIGIFNTQLYGFK